MSTLLPRWRCPLVVPEASNQRGWRQKFQRPDQVAIAMGLPFHLLICWRGFDEEVRDKIGLARGKEMFGDIYSNITADLHDCHRATARLRESAEGVDCIAESRLNMI